MPYEAEIRCRIMTRQLTNLALQRTRLRRGGPWSHRDGPRRVNPPSLRTGSYDFPIGPHAAMLRGTGCSAGRRPYRTGAWVDADCAVGRALPFLLLEQRGAGTAPHPRQ